MTDANGVVFISTEDSWLFQSIETLTDSVQFEIKAEERYLDKHIEKLTFTGELKQSPSKIRIALGNARPKNYLAVSKAYSKSGWNVRVFVSTISVTYSVFVLVLLLTLFFVLLYLTLELFIQRRMRHEEKERLQATANQQLEFQVMQRTSALHAEINERHKAEIALKNTQKELIQAAKLAVLGQLSASISHELNNPLARNT
ncbi:hypothetical protein ACLKMH_18535 [Psychromonas sp. KJ10-10]|uniref:hypothetical protein n=1 Tax=Psychromonas sp. KJ10-10 TaxID=3391823 RepID=UPI0039B622CC